jgi:hypothetical protein
MAFPWGLIVVLVGIAYGYFTPGRQSKMAILKRGLLWGLVIAVVFAVLGYFLNVDPLGLTGAGLISVFVSFVVLTLFFILGVWIGDMIEGRGSRGERRV